MIGGLTLFGYDLFGLAERARARKADENEEHAREVASPAKETADDERDPSEYYFWGMYPIY
jgi:hypothetical protein